MIGLWLTSLAVAGTPVWVDGHATAALELPGSEVGGGAGAGLAVGTGPVLLEARTDLSVVSTGPRWAVWPALRLHTTDLQTPWRWRPSVVVGLGGQLGTPPGRRRLAMAGLDLDPPWIGDRTRPRAGVWAETSLDGVWRVGLKVGLVHQVGGRTRPEPVGFRVDKDEEDAVAGTASGVDGAPSDGAGTTSSDTAGPWWDPQACAWVDDDPGGGWRPQDGPGPVATILEGTETAGAAGLERGQGWLVVVAEPGAVVRVGEFERTVGEDRTAKLTAAEGVVDVEVVGGGRRQTFEAALAQGYVLWLRATPPDEVAVQFASGSAEVDDADRVAAQALARNRGQYRLRLSGSYSPEGNLAANLELARRRAAAVSALLQEVGVPAEDLELLPPTPPRPGLTAAEQRAVYVLPVSPEEAE